jgi:hypothetical protein
MNFIAAPSLHRAARCAPVDEPTFGERGQEVLKAGLKRS